MEKGFLYIANRQKFINEAVISVQSLKRFNQEPICLICTSELNTPGLENWFDKIITIDELSEYTYLSKVVGMQETPFDRTVFLDTDTFITDKISELFDILDIVDFAATSEQKLHTTKTTGLKYIGIFPEFNSGIVVYKKSPAMQKTLKDWFDFCSIKKMGNDMPGLREAALININTIRFSILPDCYNEHGFSTMLMLHQKVKIIHERLGYRKGITTPHFLDFQGMEKFAKKINKFHHKRIYIPRIGIISYRWSPTNLILFLKKKMGHKRISKNR